MHNTCDDCVHSYPVSDRNGERMLECRRFPPVLHLVPMMPKVIGQPPLIMKQSGFPNCADICGEFKIDEAIASPVNFKGDTFR